MREHPPRFDTMNGARNGRGVHLTKKPNEATVTVLYTDVESSTERTVREGDEPAHRAMRSHREIIRKAIAEHSGKEIDSSGDSFLVAFQSARSAVACAVDIQERLEDARGVQVRIGLNAGDALNEDERLFGATVNGAARIASLATGGEVFASEVVRQLAGRTGELKFEDRGLHTLKGFPEKWRLYSIARTGPGETEQPAEPDRSGPRIRVAIVDDEALVRAGFRMLLEPQLDIEVVGEAGDGSEAVDLVRRLRPDVVLMDVRMPKLSGLEATEQLADVLGSPTRVLMLTTFDLDEYVYEALRIGASGFLVKDTPPEQLINAVRVVSTGDALLAPSVTRRLIDRFARNKKPPTRLTEELERLTQREVEVLKLVGKGKSTNEIAEELFVSEATVKTHVARVLTKLNLRDRAQAVVFSYEAGLIEPGSD
jgi:DNA-binding NarL/FixJ family response regulator/class 3 adenylate cyclase